MQKYKGNMALTNGLHENRTFRKARHFRYAIAGMSEK